MADGGGGGQHQVWEIVGGQATGGIVVRTGPELTSEKAAQRLATGAKVLEVGQRDSAAAGVRLHFRRLEGAGPEEGWVSIALNSKVLAMRVREAPSKAAVKAVCNETATRAGLDITGRWTMVSSMGNMSFFYLEHKAGSGEFRGVQIETGTEIKEGRISGNKVEWRVEDFVVTAQLAEGGRRMESARLRNLKTNRFVVGVYTGTWDAGKKKYLVENALKGSSPGLEYRHTPSLPDVDSGNFVKWGTSVMGIDEGAGWVKVMDRYLPKFLQGKRVLREDRRPSKQNSGKLMRIADGDMDTLIAARRTRDFKLDRDLLSAPEQLFGSPMPGVARLMHGQVVALQRLLAKGYADTAFQESLHAAWRSNEGSLAEQLAASQQLCRRVQATALKALLEEKAETSSNPLSAAEHTMAMANGSELMCNALLLKYLLEPELQALVATPKVSGCNCYDVAPADAGDAEAYAESWCACAQAHEELYQAKPMELWLKVLGASSLQDSFQRGYMVLFARQNREVAGCAAARREGPAVVISHVCVLPQHRGKGVGGMLLSKLMERMAGEHPEATAHSVEVVEMNARAVAWFRRLGFAVSGCKLRHEVPAALLTMVRGAPAGKLFGREICSAGVAIFPPEAPRAFLDAVARRRWSWLVGVEVRVFKEGMHVLQDGRAVDVGRAYAAGRAFFDRPLHQVLRKST